MARSCQRVSTTRLYDRRKTRPEDSGAVLRYIAVKMCDGHCRAGLPIVSRLHVLYRESTCLRLVRQHALPRFVSGSETPSYIRASKSFP